METICSMGDDTTYRDNGDETIEGITGDDLDTFHYVQSDLISYLDVFIDLDKDMDSPTVH